MKHDLRRLAPCVRGLPIGNGMVETLVNAIGISGLSAINHSNCIEFDSESMSRSGLGFSCACPLRAA